MGDLASLNRNLALSSACDDFIFYAKSLLCAGSYINGQELWLDTHHKSPRLKEYFAQQKAAIGAGTTTDSQWAQPLVPYQLLSAGFLQSLAPFSAFDRLLADNAFMRVPMKTRIAIATAGATGSSVSEGSSKPAARMTFGSLTLRATEGSKFSCR